MDRINGADWIDIGGGKRGFKDENVVGGVTGTEVTAAWMNALQENVLKVIEEAGLALDINDWTLLWQALMVGRLDDGYFSVDGFANDPPGAPAIGDRFIVGLAPTGSFVGHENEIAIWVSDWAFVAPRPWMHVGLPDRTDWRWDADAGNWLLWKATQTLAGPITLATQALIDAGIDNDTGVTPALLSDALETWTARLAADFVPVANTFVTIPVLDNPGHPNFGTMASSGVLTFTRGGSYAISGTVIHNSAETVSITGWLNRSGVDEIVLSNQHRIGAIADNGLSASGMIDGAAVGDSLDLRVFMTAPVGTVRALSPSGPVYTQYTISRLGD